ncbi:ABC transporter permease [Bosea sp. PAMC 26642]|uniref:ABC transporter permease n=1 Tax=Bosea sp. (strain PAMC 26642) TaxID=1792307 RepID=UPI00077009F4|nr:ABC transporter permease [Bosea sp. PAMC 26642]AMJ60986.1 DNA-directed RNA polymerase subunit alpha [Bosea sp. PAMC 26642]
MSDIAHDPLEPAPRTAPRPGFRINATGAFGAVILVFAAGVALFGGLVAPYDAGEVVNFEAFGPISGQFPLGTDYLGRDMLSRVLLGARYTVGIATLSTTLACSCGILLGLLAAVIGGFGDAALSRTLDALTSIPSKMMALVLVAGLGSSMPVLILTLAFIYVPGCFRITRALAVNIAAEDFVLAARARGERRGYIMLREVLPNMTGPLLADFGLRFVFVVLLLSSLSFLGLGVQPPQADWGSLVRENIGGLPYGAPAVVMPAVAIAVLTIAVNLLVDNLPGRRQAGAEKA